MNKHASERSARVASDTSYTDAAAAHQAGKKQGRAWAKEQQGFDVRWLDPDSEYVELSLFDLSNALRDPAYDACSDDYMEAFIEGAREHFQEAEDRSSALQEERRQGRRELRRKYEDMSDSEKVKVFASLDPIIKDMLRDSEALGTEQDVLDRLKGYRNLVGPSSRAFDEGGTVTEMWPGMGQ